MKSNTFARLLLLCALVVCTCKAALAAPTSKPSTQSAATRPSPEDLLSISFRDAPAEQLFMFISEKTGKPVIPQDSVKQKRITVVSTKQRPLAEAMQIIQEALRQNGIIEE